VKNNQRFQQFELYMDKLTGAKGEKSGILQIDVQNTATLCQKKSYTCRRKSLITPLKIYIFERFKNQKNRADFQRSYVHFFLGEVVV